MTQYNFVDRNKRFGKTSCMHLQDGKVSPLLLVEKEYVAPTHWYLPTKLDIVTFQNIILKMIFPLVTYSIATAYGLDDRGVGVQVPVGSRMFSSQLRPDQLWGPPSFLSNMYRGALSPGVKRPGRKANNSLPTSAEVKKMWIYTSTPPYALIA
jgi:hypothetical protein